MDSCRAGTATASVERGEHAAWASTSRSRPTWWCWPRAWCRSPPTARRSARSATPRPSSTRAKPGPQLDAPGRLVADLGHARGHGPAAPDLSARPRPAGADERLPRFALHLFPLRDAADGHLCGGLHARAQRYRGLPRGRRGRGAEGDPVRGAGLARGRRASSLGRPLVSRIFTCSAARSANAAPRSAPSAASTKTRKGTPLPNPGRCRRCGICLGACPERIISFADYSIDIVSSMIKAVNIPDEFEEKPRLLGSGVRKRRLAGTGGRRARPASLQSFCPRDSRCAAWERSM